jgi:hypothetical protein
MRFLRDETVVGAQNLNDELTQLISFSPLTTLTEVEVRENKLTINDASTVIRGDDVLVQKLDGRRY